LSGLVNKPTVDIIVNEIQGRKKMTLKEKSGESVKLPVFYDREDVSGKVIINLNKLKKLEHSGIKIELSGLIEQVNDKKNVSRFITITRDLEPVGIISSEITNLNFEFKNVEKQFETYRGNNIIVKYTLKVIVLSKMRQATQEIEFGVINPRDSSILDSENDPIKLEVGIEDWLHLIFDVHRNKFGLRGCITGQVTFKKVSIRLKSMELQIIKKETIGAGKYNIKIIFKIFFNVNRFYGSVRK
jgi:vacuolar protein sorting-associated protein 26